MAKKKRLSPIPFEAQQAQSEWLLDRFDRGLNSYPEYYEKDELEEESAPRSHVTDYSFNIAVPEVIDWLTEVREGRVLPSVNPYTVCTVNCYYVDALDAYTFKTMYKRRKFQFTMSHQQFEFMRDDTLQAYATAGLLRAIENWRNEDEQAECPRF